MHAASKARSSETYVDFQRTTRRYTPEDRNLLITAVRTINPTLLHLMSCEIIPCQLFPSGNEMQEMIYRFHFNFSIFFAF
jgi:hypothetical protein